MEQETLRAMPRAASGTRPTKRLRREGMVPAVVYGRGVPAMPVAVSGRELHAALHTEAGLNAVINVVVDGGQELLTVAREIQRDPVRGTITHLDFIKISLDVEIHAEVTIEYTGTPVGVKDEGGFVETIETAVTVSALPMQVPSHIEADISHLGVGDTLKVSDLPALEGVTYLTEGDHPLATVVLPSMVEEEPEPLEEELLAEGEIPPEEAAAEGVEPEEAGEAAEDEG